MTMTEYLDARYKSYEDAGNNKEMYTISFNQQLTSLNTSLYVNYSRQTYWDNDASTTWNTSISRYFDLGRFKNLSVNLSAFRTENADYKDDGVYASVSIPWGKRRPLAMTASTATGEAAITFPTMTALITIIPTTFLPVPIKTVGVVEAVTSRMKGILLK